MKIRPSAIRISMISLGCPKTLVDSEVILGKLADARYRLEVDPASSDVVLLNTCGFIKEAKQESIDAILKLIELKKTKNNLGLVVVGCLVQRYADELKKEFPEIDAFLGSGDYEKIVATIRAVADGKKVVSVRRAGYLAGVDEPRVPLTPKFYRYLKISEGCDHTCSFCVIPALRGRFRSRSVPDVVEEARILVRQGAKELVLIGQDITKFGCDHAKKPLLPRLLRELENIEGLHWVRLLYAYPSSLTDETVQMMASSSKICHYLDLPLQHISDRILTAMRRGCDKERTISLIRRLRVAIPDIVLRTSLIVGFPGETEQEFRELLDFMEEVKFERLGIFMFSPEEGSPAAVMPHQIPEKIKKERHHRAMRIQQRISGEVQQRTVGQTLEVLVESKDSMMLDRWVGRTERDAPEVDGRVLVRSSRPLRPGTFYKARVTGADAYDLLAEI
ncbi:MAG: 30S ribosomal protein S12 methylthiotransferase RimO [Candidatus Omnitrophica bacterium]|nr:30S ribosomal protein S12 methylthiotransferase RimO [Candidatus Omnitrophota bacterium]